MSTTEARPGTTTGSPSDTAVPFRLEVVVIPIADYDRAKDFYVRLGWRVDADVTAGTYRLMQVTPPGSSASVIFGTEVTTAPPGSADGLLLAVDDIDVPRQRGEHGEYEPTSPPHHWSAWYAAYTVARNVGRDAEQAVLDATAHVEGALR